MKQFSMDICFKNQLVKYEANVSFIELMIGIQNNIYKVNGKFLANKQDIDEFVKALILNYPLPVFYVIRDKDGKLEILNNMKEIMCLYFYYIGKAFPSRYLDFEEIVDTADSLLPIKTFITLDDTYDITYANLGDVKRLIDRQLIKIIELKTNTEADINKIRQMF